MIEGKHISKFFLALVDAGGDMARTTLAGKIFARNWKGAQLDELLKVPLLAGIITETRERVRRRACGRHPVRYVLTPFGFKLARLWKLPVTSDRIAPEETQNQFRLLLQDGNPWAKTLQRDAELWRQHAEQEKQLRAKKAAEQKEKERMRAQNPTKDPANKKPHPPRGARSDSQRARFIQSKIQERAPLPQPARTTPAAPQSTEPVYSGYGGRFRDPTATAPLPAVSSVAQRPQVRPRLAVSGDDSYLSSEALAEIRKITAAGYRTNEKGEVLYDNKWIPRAEWKKKMPGVLE